MSNWGNSYSNFNKWNSYKGSQSNWGNPRTTSWSNPYDTKKSNWSNSRETSWSGYKSSQSNFNNTWNSHKGYQSNFNNTWNSHKGYQSNWNNSNSNFNNTWNGYSNFNKWNSPYNTKESKSFNSRYDTSSKSDLYENYFSEESMSEDSWDYDIDTYEDSDGFRRDKKTDRKVTVIKRSDETLTYCLHSHGDIPGETIRDNKIVKKWKK